MKNISTFVLIFLSLSCNKEKDELVKSLASTVTGLKTEVVALKAENDKLKEENSKLIKHQIKTDFEKKVELQVDSALGPSAEKKSVLPRELFGFTLGGSDKLFLNVLNEKFGLSIISDKIEEGKILRRKNNSISSLGQLMKMYVVPFIDKHGIGEIPHAVIYEDKLLQIVLKISIGSGSVVYTNLAGKFGPSNENLNCSLENTFFLEFIPSEHKKLISQSYTTTEADVVAKGGKVTCRVRVWNDGKTNMHVLTREITGYPESAFVILFQDATYPVIQDNSIKAEDAEALKRSGISV